MKSGAQGSTMADARGPVTQVLDQVHRGDADAKERLIAIVYDEVRQVAARMMERERRDHTLEPTALVHEAMVKLLRDESIERMPNRRYFYATLATTMRQVLIDHARKRAARKRQK